MTSTAFCSLAMKRRTRCSGRKLTYFCTVSMRSSPASCSQRRRLSTDHTLPSPASFSSASCTLAITSSGAGEKSGRAVVPVDHHVHGIGAGQLLVDAARRIERLLAVGNLVGQSVARGSAMKAAVNSAKRPGRSTYRVGPLHHAVDHQPTIAPSPSISASAGVRSRAGRLVAD